MTAKQMSVLEATRHYTQKLVTELIAACFPPACAHCNRSGALFCAHCQATIEWVTEPICIRCGKQKSKAALCTNCTALAPLAIERIFSLSWFKPPMTSLIHKLKYHGLFALAQPLGALAAEKWVSLPHKVVIDAVVPIPLHLERLQQRGYNQAQLIAQTFAHETTLSLAPPALLRKINVTVPQVGLTGAARHNNMIGAFAADPVIAADKQFLLIDDVCTTGATLNAAATALCHAGAKAVYGLTVAHAA